MIAENFNAVLLLMMQLEKNKVCMQIAYKKAEFLFFMLLSSCIYKTETNILIAATHKNMILSYTIAVNNTFN